MKCPHCNYVDLTRDPTRRPVIAPGEHGRFFQPHGNLMQLLRRSLNDHSQDVASIVGCPNCKKLFIDFD